MAAQGFRVLRFWNSQVLGETDAVLDVIRRALEGDLSQDLPQDLSQDLPPS